MVLPSHAEAGLRTAPGSPVTLAAPQVVRSKRSAPDTAAPPTPIPPQKMARVPSQNPSEELRALLAMGIADQASFAGSYTAPSLYGVAPVASLPPNTTTTLPVHTAVANTRAVGVYASLATAVQVSVMVE